MDTRVDDIIVILRNLVERLPYKRTNEQTKESQLSSTYVDAIIRPLLDDPTNDNFLIWSNNIVSAGQLERPDFVRMELANTRFYGPSCVGEIKGEDKTNDQYLPIVDLMRIALMGKESIDRNYYSGILGIHVVDFQVTFYLNTLFAEGLYILYEICSVTMPRTIQELRPFLSVEDMLPIKGILNQCKVIDDSIVDRKKEGISMNQIIKLHTTGPFTFNK
ncbi:hypothetical protein BDB01DRAFT_725487 [Pilobolus umbonatus]|nr:hypothetical protein BDB01DRAFT_725487 [Pilobolus umbonatus]